MMGRSISDMSTTKLVGIGSSWQLSFDDLPTSFLISSTEYVLNMNPLMRVRIPSTEKKTFRIKRHLIWEWSSLRFQDLGLKWYWSQKFAPDPWSHSFDMNPLMRVRIPSTEEKNFRIKRHLIWEWSSLRFQDLGLKWYWSQKFAPDPWSHSFDSWTRASDPWSLIPPLWS